MVAANFSIGRHQTIFNAISKTNSQCIRLTACERRAGSVGSGALALDPGGEHRRRSVTRQAAHNMRHPFKPLFFLTINNDSQLSTPVLSTNNIHHAAHTRHGPLA
jgi:hypothetical protein